MKGDEVDSMDEWGSKEMDNDKNNIYMTHNELGVS
jgi:hypothetical protein